MSDAELFAKSEGIYDVDSLLSKNHTLDSSLFGASVTSGPCSICKQNVDKCVGHYHVIQLPFPIIKAICLKECKTLIELICPVCSHFLISNIKMALELLPAYRLSWIKKETVKLTSGGTKIITCPVCENKVTTIKVTSQEPQLRFAFDNFIQNTQDQLNPAQIQVLLQNFTQLEEAGFSESFDPVNFMTSFIPIIPNKLRPKTIMSAESNLTGYYKVIIEEICPELYKINKTISQGSGVIIERGELQNIFNRYYDKLISYYLIITDSGADKTKEVEMALIEKRDKKHAD